MEIVIPPILLSRKIASEPNWEGGEIGGKHTNEVVNNDSNKDGLADLPVQQSDMLKPIFMDIVTRGLQYAYEQYKEDSPLNVWISASGVGQTSKPRKVIIVGAGMAGLAAAYELRRCGHIVQILELQERVGGRVKTFGEKDGFAKGLYVDGGAMRLPNKPKDPKTHFLTDYYAKTKFDLPLVPFNNSDDNAFLKFYNMTPMSFTEWKDGEDKGYTMFNNTWPGWNSKIGEDSPIRNIDDYYSSTSKIVTDQLRKKLVGKHTYKQKSAIWAKWIENWSRFPLNGFLRSKAREVLSKLDADYRDIDATALGKLIPWPEEAITAYSVYNYTEQLDQSLVQFLRDELGEWWSNDMHHIDGGMSKLPECFYDLLKEDITFNVTVKGIEYTATSEKDLHVKITGYFSTSGQPCEFHGDAAIVTTPLHIIRQIKMTNTVGTPEFPNLFYQAIEDVWYGPSTKIMIQMRTRFWDKPGNKKGIKGGFSKTNLPIGQLHYPTAPEVDPKITTKAHHPKITKPTPEKGILLVYTWKSEALQFGALHPQIAIREAVRQIGEIHKDVKIEDEFEVGAVQAWYNEPSAQGAYVLLKPHQYRNIARLWQYPFLNIFFAGEGISYAAGWIQGALESGLRAAYQFYARNEDGNIHCLEEMS